MGVNCCSTFTSKDTKNEIGITPEDRKDTWENELLEII